MSTSEMFVGIDVSKAQLDIAIRPEGRFVVPNTEAGVAEFIERVKALPVRLVVLEATGGLQIPLASALALAEVPVVVVNPRQIRDFAKATGQLAKTDAIDAEVLARFAEAIRPEPRPLADEQTQVLAALVLRRHQLIATPGGVRGRTIIEDRTRAIPHRAGCEAGWADQRQDPPNLSSQTPILSLERSPGDLARADGLELR